LFFSKKRKVVVKKEMHQKEGAMVKKHRVLLDGKNLEDEDFAIEVAGSLRSFATTNLFSVDNLKERLKQRNQMISQLRDQIRNTKQNIRDEVNKGLEKDRVVNRQEIQLLKSSLVQQDELVKQLQNNVSSTEKMVMDITGLQDQAS
jgi:predicted RNase H-like nuclease (RuvC/YqgF family)